MIGLPGAIVAGCGSSATVSTSPTPTKCQVGAAGATFTVDVSAFSGCSWNAVSGAAWITVSSADQGKGSGNVALRVAANGGDSRSGMVTIAGQALTIMQAAAVPPPATCVVA